MLLHLTGADWEDVCRGKAEGPQVIQQLRDSGRVKGQPLLFPPTLLDLTLDTPTSITQLPCIMQYLAEKHNLAGSSLLEKTRALMITTTWNDLLENAMTAFHPIDLHASYTSQKEEAQPYIKKFLESRLPKFLQFFEDSLRLNGGGAGYMVGSDLSFADVAMLNMMRGYRGSAMEHFQSNEDIPLLKALEERLLDEPKIKEFLHSDKTVNIFTDSFC